MSERFGGCPARCISDFRPTSRKCILNRPLGSVDIGVGKALTRLRLDRRLSVDEMALALNIAAEQLSAIEDGLLRVPAEVLFRATTQFRIPVSTFYE